MTLALYLAFLVSQQRYSDDEVSLVTVLADFAKVEAFAAYVKAQGPYVLSDAAKAELIAGRKISAIKLVRAEHPLVNGATLGLRQAKDIVDAYVLPF